MTTIVPPTEPQSDPEGRSFSEANIYNLDITAGTLSHILGPELEGRNVQISRTSVFFSPDTILDRLRLSGYAIKHGITLILKQISGDDNFSPGLSLFVASSNFENHMSFPFATGTCLFGHKSRLSTLPFKDLVHT